MTTQITLPKIKFYTTRYASQDINNLKPLLGSLDTMLVDVRFSPIGSDMMRWRKIYLKALLREKYQHISQLGSRAGRNQIQNLDLGIKILISFNANVVLMCECDDQKECHRILIVQELRRKGFEAEELEDWKLG